MGMSNQLERSDDTVPTYIFLEHATVRHESEDIRAQIYSSFGGFVFTRYARIGTLYYETDYDTDEGRTTYTTKGSPYVSI